MDRGGKRKSGFGYEDEHPAKRFKATNGPLPPDAIASVTGETPESTTEFGLRFVQHLRAARDKNNRTIADAFDDLPDPNFLPEYYQDVLLPVSIRTIEAKLHARQYSSITGVEADTKRMVSNAKQFNDPQSRIHADAERVRKTTSNWMTKNNPAYKLIEGHSTQPTPLPEHLTGLHGSRSAHRLHRRRTSPIPMYAPNPATEPEIKEPPPPPAPVEPAAPPVVEGPYSGLSFQEAQEKLVGDLINYREQIEDDFDYFGIFQNLPARSLTDYYQLIKNPMSLKGVEKRIKGIKGRDVNTGVSEFRTWDALEAEMKKIWENARLYNEDGSDIYNLAGELEELFQQRFEEVKQQVPGPSQPSLKLNLGIKPSATPTLKIRLGSASQKDSPDPASAQKSQSPALPANNPTISADQAALQRQKALVQAGTSYTGRSPAVNDAVPLSRPPLTNGYKSDQLNAATLAQMGTQRSQSSYSNNIPPPAASYIPEIPFVPPVQSIPQPYIPQAPPQAEWDLKWRSNGKDASDALLQTIKIVSHPDLHLPDSISYTIKPATQLAQQNYAIHVPPSSYKLRLEIGLHETLIATNGTARPYKIFCTHNAQRVSPIRPPDAASLFFDVTLAPANRTEIECVAAAGARGAGKPGDLEREKTGIFLHLLGLHA